MSGAGWARGTTGGQRALAVLRAGTRDLLESARGGSKGGRDGLGRRRVAGGVEDRAGRNGRTDARDAETVEGGIGERGAWEEVGNFGGGMWDVRLSWVRRGDGGAVADNASRVCY